MSIKTEVFGADKNILVAPELAFTVGVIISNAGISAGADGKKVVKAGEPLAGDLLDRQTAFEVGTTGAVAVLLHDVDVTDGNANGTAVVSGAIDLLKLDAGVKAKYDETLVETLAKINFINGRGD